MALRPAVAHPLRNVVESEQDVRREFSGGLVLELGVGHEGVGDEFDPLVVEGDVWSVAGHVFPW